jgi:colanic acid/amylovoran biosynthesis glycosyltransferase
VIQTRIDVEHTSAAPGSPKGPILYVTTTLPTLTVTFIYRELFQLEARGWKVLACSMNTPRSDRVSREAAELLSRTLYLDKVNRSRLLAGAFATLLRRPLRAARSLLDALRPLELCGIRGAGALLFHFLEAAYLAHVYRDAALRHIHCHFGSGPASIGMFLARFLGIDFSFVMHGTDEFLIPVALTAKLRQCAFAIAISAYMRSYVLRACGWQFSAKLKVVHCGIPLWRFESSVAERDQRSAGAPCEMLSVGQLQPRKGFDTLLTACAELHRRGFAFKCRIIGDGPQRNHLQQSIQMHGLETHVLMLGAVKQEHLLAHYRWADLFVLTCAVAANGDRDGIPVALMEAMAMGVPVVSTSMSGIPELIRSMEEGILVEAGDAGAVADAIVFLTEHPDRAKQMASRGRQKVRDHFDIVRTVDQLERLLLGGLASPH